MKLWDRVKKSMLENFKQTIGEGEARMTYEEAVIYAEMLAKRLVGVKCCAIFCSSEFAAAIALLACFAADVTAVPLSARYGEVHCQKNLEAISPDAIITDEDGKYHIRQIADSQYEVPRIHPALIMCTSGTTGKPKGVMLSEENILTNVYDIASYFTIDRNDAILIARPLYHCAVLTGEFLTALIKGVKIQFYSGAFHPPRLLELVKEYGITALCGTPTLIGMVAMLQRAEEPCTLKHICISGECMDKETGMRIQRAFPKSSIYHVYGLTEASPRVSYLPPHLFAENADSVGVPLASVDVKVRKDNGDDASVGEEGVLWIKGDNVMLGYYRDRQKTKAVLRNGWLCTGDLAVLDANGLLRIKGRRDDLIIKAGMNIYPAEIEAALKADARVREVLAYGYQTRHGVQIGVKIVCDLSSPEEVKKMCMERLPAFAVPTRIDMVDALPKNGSGKLIRGAKHAGV